MRRLSQRLDRLERRQQEHERMVYALRGPIGGDYKTFLRDRGHEPRESDMLIYRELYDLDAPIALTSIKPFHGPKRVRA